MPLNPAALSSVFRYRRWTVFFAIVTICLGIERQALAQAPYDNMQTPEGWAWAQIKQGKEADFNERCKTTPALDPRAKDETRWTNDCRRLSASFVVDVLTRAPWRGQVPFAGVTIIGARIEGDIDLRNAKLDRALFVAQCRIENDIDLEAARTDSVLELHGSRVAGSFTADQFHSERSLRLDDSEFKQSVSLNFAKIDGLLDMTGATLDDELDADSLHVGAALFMRSQGKDKASFKGVNLTAANVTGNVDMVGATLDGDLEADSLRVGAALFMRSQDENKASFKGVILTAAKVAGTVDMEGATLDGDLNADALQVGGSLFMRSTDQNKASFKGVILDFAKVTAKIDMDGATFDGELSADSLQVGGLLSMQSASFKRVSLNSANVTGTVDMEGATFDGDLNADSLHVGADLFMHDIISTQPINMADIHIGSSLEILGAKLAGLDLSGASVAGDLRLGVDETSGSPMIWHTKDGKPSDLTLRNTRIANLADARDAWPIKGHLHLDGFTFAHLGGFGATGPEMRDRGMGWWDDWTRLDTAYSPTPYEQLASALVAAGDHDAADEIRYLGRVRERETEEAWGPWIVAGFLQYVAGFGIGDYTFRVLYWVIGISLAGAVYLWQCVPAAHARGPMWCFGASLSRLLPVIEINQEFSDFFNDPDRTHLTGRQSFVFSAIGMVGWVLGAILIAAVSGLTQKP